MWVMHAGQAVVENATQERMLTAVQEAISAGTGEIWIERQRGPMLAVVIGSNRAMVLRLAEPGDAGYHAIDPAASPEPSGEYILANGQVDQYADRDTVEVRHIMPIVTHFLATMDRWPGVAWKDDNAG
jgi:hypothetical protein